MRTAIGRGAPGGRAFLVALAHGVAGGHRHAGDRQALVAVGRVDLLPAGMADADGGQPVESHAHLVATASLLAAAGAASRLRTQDELATVHDLAERSGDERPGWRSAPASPVTCTTSADVAAGWMPAQQVRDRAAA